jgi:hypothetical protein
MNNSPSIALLVCHFGAYPWYLPYFIHSCKFNPTIDFYIITDTVEPIPHKPDNVKIVYHTLDSFKLKTSEKLGFDVGIITSNNKVADFKPAFSFLFPEITASYDFWGYADLDIIFGNIRDFMTDEVLNHDVISGRHDGIYGKFCLFRNSPKTQTLFMQSRDYRQIFSRPQKFYFDGCNVLLDKDKNASILDFSDGLQSMTFVVKKAQTEGKVRAFFDFLGLAGLMALSNGVYWNKGVLMYKNEFECMYCDLSQYYAICQDKKVADFLPDEFGFGLTLSNS